jgi:hypothetical protein
MMFGFRSKPKPPEHQQHQQKQQLLLNVTNTVVNNVSKKPKSRLFPKPTPSSRAMKRTNSHQRQRQQPQQQQPPPPHYYEVEEERDAVSLDDSSLYTSQSKSTVHYVRSGNHNMNHNMKHNMNHSRNHNMNHNHDCTDLEVVSISDSDIFAELTQFKQRQQSRKLTAVSKAAPSLLTPVTVESSPSSSSSTTVHSTKSAASIIINSSSSSSTSDSVIQHDHHHNDAGADDDDDAGEEDSESFQDSLPPPPPPPLSRRFVFNAPDPDASCPVDLDLDSDLEDYHDEDRMLLSSSRSARSKSRPTPTTPTTSKVYAYANAANAITHGPVDCDLYESIPVDLDDSIISSSVRSSSISSLGLSPISKVTYQNTTSTTTTTTPPPKTTSSLLFRSAPNNSNNNTLVPRSTQTISSPLGPSTTKPVSASASENDSSYLDYIWSDMGEDEALGPLLTTAPTKTCWSEASSRDSNSNNNITNHKRMELESGWTDTSTTIMGTTATARLLRFFPEPPKAVAPIPIPLPPVAQTEAEEQGKLEQQDKGPNPPTRKRGSNGARTRIRQEQEPQEEHERSYLKPEEGGDEHSSAGAVLLTQAELEKHLEKSATIQAPSLGMPAFEAWKLQQQQQQEYYRKVQAAHQQKKLKNQQRLQQLQQQAQATSVQPPLHSTGSVMSKSMASTLPTYDDPALRHTTKHNNAASPTTIKSSSNTEQASPITTSSKSSPTKKSSHGCRWNPFRRRKQKLSTKKTTGKQKKTKPPAPVLPLQQFLDVSTTEPADVAAFSVAPLNLMREHLAIADSTVLGETEGATKSHASSPAAATRKLALKFLEQERKKQRQALYDKERDERQEQERIARLKQEALEKQRKLQQELELERRNSVGNVKQQQQQEAQVEVERQRQQQEADILAQELAEDLQQEAELEYQKQLQELKQEAARLKQPQAQQRPPLASRKNLTEKLKVLDVYHSPQRTKSIFDEMNIPRGSTSSRNSVTSSSVGPGQSTGMSVLSTGTSVLAPCILCETGERTHISMPCMHYMFCQSCVEDMRQRDVTTCPVCEAEEVAFTHVNL